MNPALFILNCVVQKGVMMTNNYYKSLPMLSKLSNSLKCTYPKVQITWDTSNLSVLYGAIEFGVCYEDWTETNFINFEKECRETLSSWESS